MEYFNNRKVYEWEYKNYLVLYKTKKHAARKFKNIKNCFYLLLQLALFTFWILFKNAIRIVIIDSKLYIKNNSSHKFHDTIEAQSVYHNLHMRSWKIE